MNWLKRCPKCGGDLYKGVDVHGVYVSCRQCGRGLTEMEEKDFLLQLTEGRPAASWQKTSRLVFEAESLILPA